MTERDEHKAGKHLPLRIAPLTPNRIDTADGRSLSINWRTQPADNPYEEAEDFAAFIVRAANAHDDLVAALGNARAFMQTVMEERGDGGVSILIRDADEALSRTKGAQR